MIKTTLAIIPDLLDGTSFYRGAGPLSRLHEIIPWHHIMLPKEINWYTVGSADLVFLQRPALDAYLQAVVVAKQNNKPVWLDYDDDLFNVPFGSPAHDFYAQPKIQDIIKRICLLADVITVSTQELVNVYSQYNKNVRVIPNAWDLGRLPFPDEFYPRNNTIAWRGSSTHDRDLLAYADEIVAVQNETGACLRFFGNPCWQVVERCNRNTTVRHMYTDVTGYLHQLKQAKPKLVMVPLEDNHLNRSKSNIAWLEATWAGAATLAPNWDEWQHPGILNYWDKGSFKQWASEACREDFGTSDLINKSRTYIEENLTLDKTNVLRAELIKELLHM